MSSRSSWFAALPLAPSELVFLNGEKFAHDAGALSSRVKLLHTDAKVSARELGEAILATAVLVGELAGNIRLAVRAKKTLFGLRTVNTLYAEAGQEAMAWPEHSLESRAGLIVRSGPVEVNNLIHVLLLEDAEDPWHWSVSLVEKGLAERGLLQTEETRHLKVFTTKHHTLPESTRVLAAQYSSTFADDLLNQTRQSRPDVWKLLVEQIEKGVRRRKKVEEGDEPSFDQS